MAKRLPAIGLSMGSNSAWAGLATELATLAPVLLVAGLWLGAEGMLVAALSALPLMLLRRLGARRALAPDPARSATGGLPHRQTVVQALDRGLAATGQGWRTTACIVLGLDDPTAVIENHCQAAFEQVVHHLVERLATTVRPQDVVARLDGDRFAIALSALRRADLETLIQICGRIQSVLHEPIPVDGATIYASVSAGFCLASRAPDRTGEGLIAAAETALADARRNGPSAIRAFSPEVAAAAREDIGRQDRIAEALDHGEIVAWFQPQLSTDTGEVTGFEALARWKHPERGILPPSEFLPAITAGGLSARLGETMLFQTLTALRCWDRAGYRVPAAAVNFCREELRNPRLTERMHWELDRFDLAAARLTIEILETVVAEAENDTIVRNIAALAAMGCGIDLDDFGTGHASITSIRRFAVNRIKIDRSFVTHVDSDGDQQKMIAAILSMADRLGLQTLAEGVETLAEHAMLAQLGCGHVQGYAIARPMPFDETIGWLERHRGKLAATAHLSRRIG